MTLDEQLILIQDYVNEIPTSLITKIKKISPILSKSRKRRLLNRMKEYRNNKIEETFSSIFLYAIYEPDNAIVEARLKGVFRYKAYGFDNNGALLLLKLIFKYSSLLSFSKPTIKFLESKINCSVLWDIYKKSESQIINAIKKADKEKLRRKQDGLTIESSFFKELLVFIDIFFMSDQRPILISDQMKKNQLECFSKEQVSEAVSYIIFLYDKIIGIDETKHYMVNPEKVFSRELKKIVFEACKVRLLEEYELRVDYLGYSVTLEHKNLHFYSQDSNIEKSFKLGFINKDIQTMLWYRKLTENETEESPLTIDSFVNLIIENSNAELIQERNDWGIERYVFSVPRDILPQALKKIDYFEEERIEITNAMKESLDDKLENKMITKHARIRDLVLLQRYFRIFDTLVANFFSQKKYWRNSHKVANSLISHISHSLLQKQLSFIIDDANAIDELLDLLTYKNDYKLDLQYTPFICTQNGYFFSSQVLAKSNLLRNVIVNAYIRSGNKVNESFNGSPLEKYVSKIFRSAGYKVYENLAFTYDKIKGEIDVLVTNGKFFLFIECKAPFEPTGLFETRSLLQNIKKADNQLDLIKKTFEDVDFAEAYCKSRNIIFNENFDVKTCIMLGSRLFSASGLAKHPIRSVHGFPNVLSNGTVEGSLGKWRFWETEKYSHNDLFNYLDDEKSIISKQFCSMTDHCEEFKIKGYNISFQTFSLNNIRQVDVFDDNYTILNKKTNQREELLKNLADNEI